MIHDDAWAFHGFLLLRLMLDMLDLLQNWKLLSPPAALRWLELRNTRLRLEDMLISIYVAQLRCALMTFLNGPPFCFHPGNACNTLLRLSRRLPSVKTYPTHSRPKSKGWVLDPAFVNASDLSLIPSCIHLDDYYFTPFSWHVTGGFKALCWLRIIGG